MSPRLQMINRGSLGASIHSSPTLPAQRFPLFEVSATVVAVRAHTQSSSPSCGCAVPRFETRLRIRGRSFPKMVSGPAFVHQRKNELRRLHRRIHSMTTVSATPLARRVGAGIVWIDLHSRRSSNPLQKCTPDVSSPGSGPSRLVSTTRRATSFFLAVRRPKKSMPPHTRAHLVLTP